MGILPVPSLRFSAFVFISIFTLFALLLSPLSIQAGNSTPPVTPPSEGWPVAEYLGLFPVPPLPSTSSPSTPAVVYGPFQPQPGPAGESLVSAPAGVTEPQAPDSYSYETVDADDCTGNDLAIDLDPNGRPHLVYYDSCSQAIKYAVRDEDGWHRTKIYISNSDVGRYNDIVVDDNGVPHFVFYDATNTNLWYGSLDSQGYFFFEIVADTEDSGSHCSIDIDPYGRLHVSYFFLPYEDLNHMIRDGSGWHSIVETVDSSGRGKYSSIAADSSGYPHFSYADEYTDNLRYARQVDDYNWSSEAIDPNSGTATHSSIAIDSYGWPHVSYYTNATNDLKYAYKNASGWHRITFQNANDQGWYNSLALDANDHPHIVYWDETENRLWMAYNHGSGWQYESIYGGSPSSPNGGWSDFVLDANDQPFAAYVNTNPDVEIAYQSLALPANLSGYQTMASDLRDANRCAVNIVSQFNSLRDHGEVMGFHLGGHPVPGFNIDLDFDDLYVYPYSHWQGMQRLAGEEGFYLALTQDHIYRKVACPEGTCTEEWSGFAIPVLYSRDNGFDRFRSNRLNPDTYFQDTPPSYSDGVMQTVYISKENTHPGGIQASGEILAVSLENEEPRKALLYFYDLTQYPGYLNPDESPLPRAEQLEVPGSSGTATALTKLADGRYLLAVSNTGPEGINFFISYDANTLDVSGNGFLRFIPLDWFSADELRLASGVDFQYDGWDGYQGMNFVTECGTGDLYLLMAGNRDSTSTCTDKICAPFFGWPCLTIAPFIPGFCWPDGDDVADLHKVTLEDNEVKLTRVAQRHFYCRQHGSDGDHRHCNFDAATGTYVDPSGHLYLYSSEHENDGPSESGVHESVKFMEFRPVPHGDCSTTSTAWVELYDNPLDDKTAGEGLMIDYRDRNLENYFNYDDAEDFEDQAEAVRWCLPTGLSYRIYQHKEPCSGKLLTLYGNNTLYTIDDLETVNMKDRASCSYFANDPQIVAGVGPAGQTLVYVFIYNPSPNIPELALPLQPAADLYTTINFPAGTFSASLEATYTPNTPLGLPEGHLLVGSHSFILDLSPSLPFLKPATVTIEYNDVEIEGLYSETMSLLYRQPGDDTWIEASQTCGPATPPIHDLQAQTFQTVLCAAGEYALVGVREYLNYLPTTHRP